VSSSKGDFKDDFVILVRMFMRAGGGLILGILLLSIVITTVVVYLAPPPEYQGPVVTELSQTDQATCDELERCEYD